MTQARRRTYRGGGSIVVHGYWGIGLDDGLYYSTDGLNFRKMGLDINLLRPRDSSEAFYWRDRGLYSFRFESGNWTTVNISNPEKSS